MTEPRTVTPVLVGSRTITAGSSGAFLLEEPSGTQKVIDPVAAAAEAFLRGQAALRDDQVDVAIEELSKAVELNPSEFEYQAVLVWAQFCGAADKVKLAEKTRKMLNHAVQKSLKPDVPRFYLGRVERMLGRDREALRHFQEVLENQPRHTDAASEIRMIEARLASGSGEKPGLGGLFRKKS